MIKTLLLEFFRLDMTAQTTVYFVIFFHNLFIHLFIYLFNYKMSISFCKWSLIRENYWVIPESNLTHEKRKKKLMNKPGGAMRFKMTIFETCLFVIIFVT